MKKFMLAIAVAAIATFSVTGVNAHPQQPAKTEQAPAKEKKAEKKAEKASKKEHEKKAKPADKKPA